MRLAWKFTLAFVVSLCVVLSVYAYRVCSDEIARLKLDTERDQATLGYALLLGVRQEWERGGESAAMDFVQRANRSEAKNRISVRWVWLGRSALGPGVRLPADRLALLETGQPVEWVDRDVPPFGVQYTYTPIHLSGDRRGAIEVSESLEDEIVYRRATIRGVVVATVTVAMVSAMLSWVLGLRLVGRPVASLIAQAREVASGHFDRRVELHQRDELGELAGEFNKMCDQLAAARDRLAAETTARIHTLELLRHADRLKTVGQLASGIAHELGTPLNVVRARAKMIVSDAASPSEAQSNARIVVEQSDRMARIIRQLLDFARPRAARRASADLRNVAARTAEMFSAMAAKQNVRIALDLGEIPLVAEVDADQIQQVQSNLVLNAIQAMPQGGEVTIELSAETAHPPESPPSVSIECLCLRVRDTGQGIRPEEIEHIFEPFFSTKQAGEGTGLGLSVSRGIIEEHGGWIGVTSTVGQGSCFQVFVPRRVADASSCADRG